MKTSVYLVVSSTGSVYARKTKPNLSSDEIAVKLNLQIPDGFFKRFIPEVNIDVPEEMVIEPEIEVELVQEEMSE